MIIKKAPSVVPVLFLLLVFCTPLALSSGLKWFVSPQEESGGVSLNFPKTRDRLEQKLSGKVFLEESKLEEEEEENLEENEGEVEAGGRREPKQFRLLSNFSDLIQSNSRLAPSSTFCKFVLKYFQSNTKFLIQFISKRREEKNGVL